MGWITALPFAVVNVSSVVCAYAVANKTRALKTIIATFPNERNGWECSRGFRGLRGQSFSNISAPISKYSAELWRDTYREPRLTANTETRQTPRSNYPEPRL